MQKALPGDKLFATILYNNFNYTVIFTQNIKRQYNEENVYIAHQETPWEIGLL